MPRLLCFGIISCCLLRDVSFGQSLGVHDYVTGMTLIGKPGAGADCPPIVWLIEPNTPAAKAGVKPGDRLLAIDGKRVTDVVQARPLLRGSEAKSSTIELEGERGSYTVTVDRIINSSLYERNGWKRGPDGSLYPKDATPAEMQRVSKMQGEPVLRFSSLDTIPRIRTFTIRVSRFLCGQSLKR